jgi:nucleotide-binding universal stress UspA family protein
MATPFSRLLLATEHGEFDTGAETLALALARRCALPLAAVLPVVSNPEFEMVAPQLAAKADAEAAVRREDLQAMARAAGVALQVQVRRGAEPFAEIVDEARLCGADLLIIRRRGKRGLLANLLVGEMVSKVVAHAPCSVLVTPRGAQMWARRVLVGMDPQASDPALLDEAAGIAAACGLPLQLLCVASSRDTQAAAEQELAAALQQARSRGSPAQGEVQGEVRVGRPHEELLTATRAHGADLIVLGRHGRSSLGRAWIGGVAQKVIGLAECPVLVHLNPPPTTTP